MKVIKLKLKYYCVSNNHFEIVFSTTVDFYFQKNAQTNDL